MPEIQKLLQTTDRISAQSLPQAKILIPVYGAQIHMSNTLPDRGVLTLTSMNALGGRDNGTSRHLDTGTLVQQDNGWGEGAHLPLLDFATK